MACGNANLLKNTTVPDIEEKIDFCGHNNKNIPCAIAEDELAGGEELKEVEDEMELLELNESNVQENFGKNDCKVNRRYTLRPQKKPETTECDQFTLTTKRKTNTSQPKNGTLETIFENPVLKNGSLTLLGKAKLKRYLSFDNFVSKTKLRHRKLKLKRLGKGKRKSNSLKMSIEDVKLKLKSLEGDGWTTDDDKMA